MISNLTSVPFFDQYFGFWSMHEPAFWSQFNMIRKADLHLHLQARAEDIQAASGDSRGGPIVSNDIAIVSLSGKLMKQSASMGGGTSTVVARRQIRGLMRDDTVAGVMLHIDSPGGTVAGTQDLANDIAKLATIKPVHAYVEDLGASAAYWIGSQASFLSAGASSLVGSIGTYTVVYDMSGAAALEGVKAHVIRAGQYKGMGTPGTELTPEQLAEIQRNVDSLNAHFLQGVASGRKMTSDRVVELADGRVHVGAEAKKLGLIDAVESFDAAMSRLHKQAQQHASKRSKSMASADIVVPESSAPIIADVVQHTPQHTQHSLQAPQPATFDQIKSSCIGADANFIVAQLEAKSTLAQAQSNWMIAQNAAIAEANQRAEQAKIAATKPGVAPISSASKGTAESAAENATSNTEAFWNLVAEQTKAGRTRQQAISSVIAKHPALHQAMIEETNAARGKK